MSALPDISTEELLVRLELVRRGIPLPPPATLALLVERFTEGYAQWYLDQMTGVGPEESEHAAAWARSDLFDSCTGALKGLARERPNHK